MAICYNKLWKLLIDKSMSRSELRRLAGISTNALAKMGKNESVSVEVLGKVCKVLDCNVGDIMDFVPEEGANG